MGSDARSKKRPPSPSPSSAEEEEKARKKSRKHVNRDSRERKSRKERDDDDGKPHKHSRNRDDKDNRSKEKRKRGAKHKDSFEELSENDYFSKNNEFSTWLKEERGTYFSDLSSDASRELFKAFVKQWNNQKLQSRYYEGIASGPRSSHNWKIKSDK